MFEISMSIFFYSVVYAIAIIFYFLADRTKSKQSKLLMIAFAVLTMAAVAAFRDESIGSDTQRTLNRFMKPMTIEDIFNDFSLFDDIIYAFIALVLQFFHMGSRSFLFIAELLILVPVNLCAYFRKDKAPISLSMMIFLLLYYQLGFNWIRQSISAAFLLLAVVLWMDKKQWACLLSAFLAMVFHISAIIGIVLFIVAWRYSLIKNKKTRRWFLIILVCVIYIAYKMWYNIAMFCITKGLLPSNYEGYARLFSGQYVDPEYAHWFAIGLRTYGEYCIRIAMAMIPIMFTKKDERLQNNAEFNFYKAVSILSIIIYSVGIWGIHTVYINRVTYFLDFANMIYLTFVCTKISYQLDFTKGDMGILRSHRSPINYALIIGSCAFYNIWLYIVLGWHATVPYCLFTLD